MPKVLNELYFETF